jgi:hypothetical protein
METQKAEEIIRALADGRDPATGETFPPDSPYQQADTVRALFVALEVLKRQKHVRVQRSSDPNRPKMGTPWTPDEEQQLRDGFAAQKTVPELAAAHGRTTIAITSRLVKMGLIEKDPPRRARRGIHSTGTSSAGADGEATPV